MIPALLLKRVSIARSAAAGLLIFGLVGCGTGVISYNRSFREQGVAEYAKGDYVKAGSSFKEALREEPGDYTSRFYKGQCDEQLGQLQAAIEEYRTCLNVMSHSLEGKGDVVMRRKVVDALAGAIAREPERSGDLAILEQAPRTVENKLLLAKVYRQSGDPDLAITRYEEAQQLDPNNPLIAKEYGLYLEQLGQTRKAETELRRAYALNSKDEEVAAALRRLGVVPGPSLKSEDALAKPAIPLGPIPEVDLSPPDKSSAPPANAQGGSAGASVSPKD